MYMSLVEPARDQVIKIPYLTPREKMSLARGERVQKQERNGVRGSGLVVLDVEAPIDEVFDTLTKSQLICRQNVRPSHHTSVVPASLLQDPEQTFLYLQTWQ